MAGHLVIATLPELAVKILDYARDYGRVTMSDMIRISGASRNTLKEHFRSLVEKRHLVPNGSRGQAAGRRKIITPLPATS